METPSSPFEKQPETGPVDGRTARCFRGLACLGLVFLTEQDIYDQWNLALLGLSPKDFRVFRRALGVPGLHTPSGDVLINLEQLQFALYFISRIGQPNFIMPGAVRGNGRIARTDTLDEKDFGENWRKVLAEMFVTRRLTQKTPDPIARTKVEEAVELMCEGLDRAIAYRRDHTTLHRDARWMEAIADDPSSPRTMLDNGTSTPAEQPEPPVRPESIERPAKPAITITIKPGTNSPGSKPFRTRGERGEPAGCAGDTPSINHPTEGKAGEGPRGGSGGVVSRRPSGGPGLPRGRARPDLRGSDSRGDHADGHEQRKNQGGP